MTIVIAVVTILKDYKTKTIIGIAVNFFKSNYSVNNSNK